LGEARSGGAGAAADKGAPKMVIRDSLFFAPSTLERRRVLLLSPLPRVLRTMALLRLLAALACVERCAALVGAPPRPSVRTGAQCDTWYESMEASGRANNLTYRNVRWYGAKGDGVTDDTVAITNALTYNREASFTLSTPMVVYVPPGDYVVTNTLTLWFLTHLIGNSLCPPRLLLPAGTWPGGQNYVLAGDTSYSGDHDDEFYRGIAHIDVVIGENNGGAGGIHWAVSQATFLRDMVIDLGSSGTYGIFDENGSGGFASDLTIIGGHIGLYVGNQQWTWMSINASGSSQSCVNQNWDWVSAWVGFSVSNCPIGFQFPGSNDGSILLIDGQASDIPLMVQARGGNNIFVERLNATNVPMIVSTGLTGNASGSIMVPGWRQGTAYTANGVNAPGTVGSVPLTRPDAPLERRLRPTFDGEAAVPVSVLSFGAKGDGVSDDTAALRAAIAASPTVFLPYGYYLLSGHRHPPCRLRARGRARLGARCQGRQRVRVERRHQPQAPAARPGHLDGRAPRRPALYAHGRRPRARLPGLAGAVDGPLGPVGRVVARLLHCQRPLCRERRRRRGVL
jgi:hypothetical protein